MKKTLALILGVLMLMGCLSVSAELGVTPKPMNPTFFEDFSGSTLDPVRVSTGSASLQDGALKAAPATATNFAKIYFAKEGYTTPVYLEFDLIQSGLKHVSDVQVQMALQSYNADTDKNETFLDFRWYNGNPAYIRSVSTSNAQATCDVEKAHIKIMVDAANKKLGMWVNGTMMIDENNCTDSIKTIGSMRNLAALNIDLNKQISGLTLDNVMVYPARENTIPAVGEVISHYEFDQTGVELSSDLVTKNDSTSYTVADGNFKMDSGSVKQASTKVYLDPVNKAKLTGKYVVELVVSPPWYRSDEKHRITFGSANGGTNYLSWAWSSNSSYGVTKGLFFRHSGGGSVSPTGTGTNSGYSYYDGSYTSDNRMAEFGADTSYNLKVTQLFDTDNNTVDVWFNDIYAGQRSFTNDPSDAYTSIEYIDFNLYAGNLLVYDIRTYRPANYNYNANTGLSITEDANAVTFAANAAKAGRLYFATYDGNALDAVDSAALALEPGKVYKVSKADWAGAKAFFWDADMKPIVDSWDLQ